MGGALMQLELSYKLIVTPDTSNQVNRDPLEQVLEIQSRRLDRSSPILMSIQLNDAIKEMLDAAAPGDSFNVQIIVKSFPGNYVFHNTEFVDLQSYEKSYPDTPYVYVPKPKTPNLVFTSPINKDTSVSGFSLLDYIITRDSPGALSFSVFISGGYDQPNFGPGIAINSNGYVTIYGEGTNTIVVNQAASADKKYAATTTSTQIVVSAPLL